MGETDPQAAGNAAFAREDYTKAIRMWELARAEHGRASDPQLLLRLAQARTVAGDFEGAKADAAACRELAAMARARELEASCLNALSLAHRRLDAPIRARSFAEEARSLAESLGHASLLSESHRNLGAADFELGDVESAIEHYRIARDQAEAAGDPRERAKALNNTAGVFRSLGRYAQAQYDYERALAIADQFQFRLQQSRAHGNLCALYYNLSDLELAAEHCDRALDLAEELGARPEVANVLNTHAAIHQERGSYWRALRLYRLSAEIKEEIGDRLGEARTLNNIGALHFLRGDDDEGFRAIERSLEIKRELGDLSGQAASHGTLGLMYLDRKRLADAAREFETALAFQIAVDEPEQLWRTYDHLSTVRAQQGNEALSIFLEKQAVDTIQSIRERSKGLSRQHRQSYLDHRTDVYRRLAERLIDAGRLLEAEQVLGLLKEQEFSDYPLRGDADAGGGRVAMTRGESRLRQRQQEPSRRLIALGKEIQELLRRKSEEGLSEVEEQHLVELRGQVEEAEADFDKLLDELRADLFEHPDLDFPTDELEMLTHLRDVLAKLDAETGARTAAVYILPRPEGTDLLVTSGRLEVPTLHEHSAISNRELAAKVTDYRLKLKERKEEPLEEAQELYDLLLRPIEPLIEDLEVSTLLVWLDQNLRYLPIAALHDGSRYVAEKYAVVVYTSATLPRLDEAPAEHWRIAALGVSKPHEVDVAGPPPREVKFPPLTSVPGELDTIVLDGEGDHEGALTGIRRLDEEFTEKALTDVLDMRFPVVHIASHFEFSLDANSFLLLGDGSALPVERIGRSSLRLRGVDLLTLSACQTAVGASLGRGQEIESFSVKAQRGGAKAVMATLWSVADDSTGAFMQHFYALRERFHLSKAEALRMTQALFIRGEVVAPNGEAVTFRSGELVGAAPTRYSNPFFWAPFILSGNWR